MDKTGVAHLSARSFSTLSGGERQRVLVARALAQEAPVVVLDEPTNHLDIRHQLDLIELLRDLGLTTLMAIHDLNLAAAYCEVHCTRHTEPDGALRLTFQPLAKRQ